MLTLKRKKGSVLHIGSKICIKVINTGTNYCTLGIDAPKDITILRGELLDGLLPVNRKPDKDTN